MAIKLPDPGNGIPEQKTGNDEWTNMKIVRDNFADQSNAANKLVGTSSGQIPLAQDVYSAYHNATIATSVELASGSNPDNLATGTKVVIHSQLQNMPPVKNQYGYYLVETTKTLSDNKIQTAYGYATLSGEVWTREFYNGIWKAWVNASTSKQSYTTTTPDAPNVVVDANGVLKRSTSSMKYKKLIAQLEIDDDEYAKAINVKPVIYHAKESDKPEHWHFLSFSAEELGEYDPALVFWKTHEFDSESGEMVELEEKEAEGINLNAICAVLHATNIYQDKKLKELEQRLTALESNNEPV